MGSRYAQIGPLSANADRLEHAVLGPGSLPQPPL